MNKFTLELLFQIIGIGSASGLIYKDNNLLLIGDNSGFLYQYNLTDKSLNHHGLIEKPAANISKKQKPDFEAIASDEKNIYVFGSGSTENRNKMVTLDKASKAVTTVDLTNLYLSMQSFAGIAADDFNIEGVAYDGQSWYFFQRGNGQSGKNGVFTVETKNFEEDFSILYNDFKLPKIKGVRASFTDATLVNGQLWFLATAEDTRSTYHDGTILGSLVGTIDPGKMKIGKTKVISDKNKFEGITLLADSPQQTEFLLCEDNDTDLQESNIYKLTIPK